MAQTSIPPDPSLEARVAVLEQIAAHTRQTLERIERQFDHIEGQFESRFDACERHSESRFDTLERRIETLDSRHHRDFLFLITVMIGGWVTMVGGFAGILGVMAHGFHWI
jgi:hypothetical protein